MALQHVGRKFRSRWLAASTVGSRNIRTQSGTFLPINLSPVFFAGPSSQRAINRTITTSPVVNDLYTINPSKIKSKQRPEVVMFHNPCSDRSCKLLDIIKQAQIAWPCTKFKVGDPLDFNLVVKTRIPTIEEFQDIYQLLEADTWTTFIQLPERDQSDFRSHPTGAHSLVQVIASLREQHRALPRSSETLSSKPAKAKEPQRVDKDPFIPARSHDESLAQARERAQAQFPPPTQVLDDLEHPLAGTDKFWWPIVVCWDLKMASTGANGVKGLGRTFKKLREHITGIKIPTPAEIKAMELAERQSRWSMPVKQESPPEDDTLRWFNEQGRKPNRPFPRY